MMNWLRMTLVTSLMVVLVACCGAFAQESPAALEKKLTDEFPLTKPTADKTDIVTAGAVLVLQKDNLLMYTTTTTVPPQNTYKSGKISHGVYDAAKKCRFCAYVPGVSSVAAAVPNVDTRTFVTGEKFWVTKIEVDADGVVFSLFSDPISDVRYYSLLKFPFAKGNTPTADQMLATIGEVLKVQPSDDQGGDQKQETAGQGQGQGQDQGQGQGQGQAGGQGQDQGSQSSAAMAPIAPPPPPPDAPPAAPKTIEKGQTKGMVTAILGQPTKVVKLGAKEIDVYPDMKVTFINNKVSDVQ